jgi:ankyrin repeat protein
VRCSTFVMCVPALLVASGAGTAWLPSRARGEVPPWPYATQDTSSVSRLLNAASDGNLRDVRDSLAQGAGINAADENKQTPLIRASMGGHLDVVGLLLGKGADVNARDIGNATALHWALEGKHIAVARLLVEKGADVKAMDAHGATVLALAATARALDVVGTMLDQGTDVEGRNAQGEPALYLAVRNGDLAMAKLLLARRANPNHGDTWVGSPLSQAVESKNLKMVNLLLASGADPGRGMSENGTTNLMVAVEHGNVEILASMLSKCRCSARVLGDVVAVRARPAGSAKRLGTVRRPEHLVLLLDATNATRQTSGWQTGRSTDWLRVLAPNGQRGYVRAVDVQIDSQVDNADRFGTTPLMLAAVAGRADIVKMLLAGYADASKRNDRGETALSLARKRDTPGHRQAAWLIMAASARIQPKLQKQQQRKPHDP